MRLRRIIVGLLILTLSLHLTGSKLGAGNLAIERSVFGSAGEPVIVNNQYILYGTFGEPIVKDITSETSYGLGSGFWIGGVINEGTGIDTVYLPIVLEDYAPPITLSLRNETGGTLNYRVYDHDPAAGGTLLCQVTMPPDGGLCGTFPSGYRWVNTSSDGLNCGSYSGAFLFPSGICTRVIRCGSNPSSWEGAGCNY